MNYKTLLLIGIIFLAGFFRFWDLTTVPPSLYWDEVSQAFNAYTIVTTGRDEHQEFLPIARFQAFGDYKAPTNIYLTALSIMLLGKSDFAVRFPSALLGTLTVLITYFLVKNVFYKFREADWYALVSAFLLAISPWHIQLSRAAYEANIATFFTLCGVFLFLYGIRVKSWVLLLSIISFVIGFYSFNAHRIFIPTLVLLLFLVEYKRIWELRKIVMIACIVGFILLIPFMRYFVTPESKLRFQEVNTFSDISLIKKSNQLSEQDGNSFMGKLMHNRRVIYAQKYAENYLSFFDPQFLFFKGDVNPRFSDQSNGQLFLFTVPFIVLGIYFLFWQRKQSLIILGWLLLAPIAAATAKEVPHALRSETILPMYEVVTAVGIVSFFILCHNYLKKYAVIFPLILSFFIILSCVQFWHDYLVHNPRKYSTDWQYGYRQAIEKVESIEKNYDHLYFTNTYGRAYIYAAWYGNFTAEDFWKKVDMRRDAFGFYNVSSLGKYVFTDNPPKSVSRDLYVTTGDKVPSDARIIDTINFLNGEKAFVISTNL